MAQAATVESAMARTGQLSDVVALKVEDSERAECPFFNASHVLSVTAYFTNDIKVGGLVNHTEPYSAHRPAKFVNTRNILRFASVGWTNALPYHTCVDVLTEKVPRTAAALQAMVEKTHKGLTRCVPYETILCTIPRSLGP
ncbi:hypothetical protein N7517_009765 [Penicillium concentricum]|uniref:Uncharacterized protein n=1 Tax=Penicillium concentricum TaxID=293559 RepID=A0A9W9RKJ1_9EURO|nr:uncharacterized protein N7517_009765 [Penicillium concentricum]KAJ5360574.1 hypothetical protein N7517_009765 [Penicillium concentricum]